MTLKTKNEIEIVGRERLTPALEVAKKFVAKTSSRPVLELANLNINGNLQATDSHKAIIFKDVHSYSENVCLNLKTLNIEKGWDYPDLSLLVETKTEAEERVLFKRATLKEIVAALKFFTSKTVVANKIRPEIDVTISDGLIKIYSHLFEMNIRNEETHVLTHGIQIEFTINPNFLILAFETFLSYSNGEVFEMQFRGSMKILLFENEDFIIGLLPMRKWRSDSNG